MKTRWMVLLVGLVIAGMGQATAQTVWEDDPINPVISAPGDPGVWDDGDRNPLAVIEVDGTYHLYFNGQPSNSPKFFDYDIGHATSLDGIAWTMDPSNPVLVRGADGQFDDASLWGAAVIHDGSGFRMWYCGIDGDYKRGGYASSVDGSAWSKHPGNPVIDVGPPGSFDATEVKPGAVIFQDGLYRMWYTGASAWNGPPSGYDWQIGYAESADGLSWTKLNEPVLGFGTGWESNYLYGPTVLFDGVIYRMWNDSRDTAIQGTLLAIQGTLLNDSRDTADLLRFFQHPGNLDSVPVHAADRGGPDGSYRQI